MPFRRSCEGQGGTKPFPSIAESVSHEHFHIVGLGKWQQFDNGTQIRFDETRKMVSHSVGKEIVMQVSAGESKLGSRCRHRPLSKMRDAGLLKWTWKRRVKAAMRTIAWDAPPDSRIEPLNRSSRRQEALTSLQGI